MDKLKEISQVVNGQLGHLGLNGKPNNLYEPMSYIIELGGKRIRPALVLAAYKLYKQNWSDQCISLSLTVEMFHNFTLLHDDIMDNSSLRRGKQTVHTKWDEPTAILSGDLLLIKVYARLHSIENTLIQNKFSEMAIALCEGQMLDMNFEKKEIVQNQEYLEMIEKKTAVLLAFALESGGILGGCSENDQKALYSIGIHLGLAFQLMDDYLDTFGNQDVIGKKVGGDILEGKKTFLWNALMSNLDDREKQEINQSTTELTDDQYVQLVRAKMTSIGADKLALEKANQHHQKALDLMNNLSVLNDSSYLQAVFDVLSKRIL